MKLLAAINLEAAKNLAVHKSINKNYDLHTLDKKKHHCRLVERVNKVPQLVPTPTLQNTSIDFEIH